MMMQAPLLDDRNFEDLVREGLALLPVHAPEWTDHNPSDPGVTLIELLAYFSDILLYRIGRVTPAAKLQFLRLLKGSRDYDFSQRLARDPADPEDPARAADPMDELARELAQAVRELAHMECAVTARDFERHAMAAIERELPGRRAHAHCIANTDLSGGRMRTASVAARGHVSLLVALPEDVPPYEAARVRDAVSRDLHARRLLTTRLHVVAPVVVQAGIGFSLALLPGTAPARVLADIRAALGRRYGLLAAAGAADDAGRLFGQPLNVADVAALIDRVPGVDYVEDVSVLTLGGEPDHPGAHLGVQIGTTSKVGENASIGGTEEPGDERLLRDSAGALSSVLLRPWEVLRVAVVPRAVRVIDSTGVARPLEGVGATDHASGLSSEDSDHD
jgi:hypothetical protein